MWNYLARLGVNLAGLPFIKGLNEHEVYVDRIKKDFRIADYHDAVQLYHSDPAYWARYYGPSSNSVDAKDELVRDSAAQAGIPSRRNVFEYGYPEPDPRPTLGNSSDRAARSDPSFAGRSGNRITSQASAAPVDEADGSAARVAGSVRLADIRRLTRMPPT